MWSADIGNSVIGSVVTLAAVAAGVVLAVRAASDRDFSSGAKVIAGVAGGLAGSFAGAVLVGIVGTFGVVDADPRSDLRRGILEAGGTAADAECVTDELEDRHGNLDAAMQRIEADAVELLGPIMRCQGHGADSDSRARCMLEALNARTSTPVVGVNDIAAAAAEFTPADHRALLEDRLQCVGLSEAASQCVTFRMRSTFGATVFDTPSPELNARQQRELEEIMTTCAVNN